MINIAGPTYCKYVIIIKLSKICGNESNYKGKHTFKYNYNYSYYKWNKNNNKWINDLLNQYCLIQKKCSLFTE